MSIQKSIRNRRIPKPTVKQMHDFSVEVSALAIQHERDLDALQLKYDEALTKLKGVRVERAVWASALLLSLAANAFQVIWP